MTFQSPLWQQAGSYSASEDRQALAALQTEGVDTATNSLKVTQRAAGVNMSVDIAVGSGWVTQGQPADPFPKRYFVTNTASYNLTIPTASGTVGQSRNDIVGIQVRDNQVDGGGINDWYLRVVAGTPATTGTQADPARPDSFYPLARVTVVYNATSISNSVITDLRAVSSAPGLLTSDHSWSGTQTYTGTLDVTGSLRAANMRPVVASLIGGLTLAATADSSTDVVTTASAHGLGVNAYVAFTGGTATGITSHQIYRVKTVPSGTTLTLQTLSATTTVDITGTGTLGQMSANAGFGVYSSTSVAGGTSSEGTAGTTRVYAQVVAPASGQMRVRLRSLVYNNSGGAATAQLIHAVNVYSWNGTVETAEANAATNFLNTRTVRWAGGSGARYTEANYELFTSVFPSNVPVGPVVNLTSTVNIAVTPDSYVTLDNLTPGTTYRFVAEVGLWTTSTSSGWTIQPTLVAEPLV